MARNSEKRLTGLNRFLEAKQKAEKNEERKRRPPLHTLRTSEEVKRWIPSIQAETEYILKQLTPGVKSRNYPDYKIQEFEERLQELEREHKRFVTKVHNLDPNYKAIPWQPRGYSRKRPHSELESLSIDHIPSPLLEKELHHTKQPFERYLTYQQPLVGGEPSVDEHLFYKQPYVEGESSMRKNLSYEQPKCSKQSLVGGHVSCSITPVYPLLSPMLKDYVHKPSLCLDYSSSDDENSDHATS